MGAILDLALGGVLGGGVVGGQRRVEAKVLGRDGEEEAFDRVEGAVGKDIDGVDDVVEEGLQEEEEGVRVRKRLRA
jgi:hypothetical protein